MRSEGCHFASLWADTARPFPRRAVTCVQRRGYLHEPPLMSTIEHIPTPSSETPLEQAAAVRVSVVIPCLNEEENIEACVTSALKAMAEAGIPGEVVVADNDSEDRSAEIATAAGARVVHEPRRGYGSAYLAGFAAARGRYIVMADADLTYDFAEVPAFVA